MGLDPTDDVAVAAHLLDVPIEDVERVAGKRSYGQVPDAAKPWIKRLYAAGVKYEQLAEAFECSVTWIRYIVHDYKKKGKNANTKHG